MALRNHCEMSGTSGDLAPAEAEVSVPSQDLALFVVEGQDKAPAEYQPSESAITGIQSMWEPTFARLEYVNTSGQVAVVRVKSTSGSFHRDRVAADDWI